MRTETCSPAAGRSVSSLRPHRHSPAQTGQGISRFRRTAQSSGCSLPDSAGVLLSTVPMSRRIRWFITIVFACQLLLAAGIVTTPLLAQTQDQETTHAETPANNEPALQVPNPPSPPKIMGSNPQDQTATIRAHSQEKAGDVYTLRGEVEIDYKGWIL